MRWKNASEGRIEHPDRIQLFETKWPSLAFESLEWKNQRKTAMNERIYDTLKKRILCLYYEPGQPLSQKEIAAELGVSQTPVREVFLRLEWEKLVVILPRIGIHVTKIDFKELKEVYRSRILIEGELGLLAAKNITGQQLSEMKGLLAACDKIKGERIREKLVELDKQFRDIIFEAAKCPTLADIADLLYNQTLRVWHLTFDESDLASEVSMEKAEIEETIAAFSQNDPDVAKQLRKKVIMAWIDRLHKYFTRF
jgi:DNA-binding GntR family transcriptional regulator